MIIRTRQVVNIDRNYYDRLAGKNAKAASYNEVVMVLPRPGNKVLVGSKYYYPHGLFRLPSGKIRPMESPEKAFARECWEETGLLLDIDKKIAEIVYQCTCGDLSLDAVSHVFLGSITTQPPRALDSSERINAYREIEVSKLPELRHQLMSMFGEWHSFGRFRAHAHQVVYEYLTDVWSHPTQ